MINVKKLSLIAQPDFQGGLGPDNKLFEIFLLSKYNPLTDSPGVFVFEEEWRWCNILTTKKEIIVNVFHQTGCTSQLKMTFKKMDNQFESGEEIEGKILHFDGREWSGYPGHLIIKKNKIY